MIFCRVEIPGLNFLVIIRTALVNFPNFTKSTCRPKSRDYNFALDNRVINASLAELTGAFATRGFNGDTDSLLLGAGLTAQLRNGLALSAHYGAEIGWSFSYHTVNLDCNSSFN